MSAIAELVARGEIGGRTVQITAQGAVECHVYPVSPLADGMVRVRTVTSIISPGSELTFVGLGATNPYLRKRWDPSLRLFLPGEASERYPIVFGYRAAGVVIESRASDLAVGARIFGKWRHTELTALAAKDALAQHLPGELSLDDGADLAQMLPISVNAVAYAEERHAGGATVVFGCGPVGLITAQVARATGATTVYAVDRVTSRLEIASSLGLSPVDASGEDVASRLKSERGAEGIAVAFECTGRAAALHEAVRTVRRRGTVVAVGFYQGGAAELHLGEEFHHNGVEIRSGQIGNLHPRWTAESVCAAGIDLVRRGVVVLARLPRTRVPVEEAARAFDALTRPEETLQVAFSYDEN